MKEPRPIYRKFLVSSLAVSMHAVMRPTSQLVDMAAFVRYSRQCSTWLLQLNAVKECVVVVLYRSVAQRWATRADRSELEVRDATQLRSDVDRLLT